MIDPHNPTATALQLLNSFDVLAKEWDADGNHADAQTIREKGPRFAAALAELIAADPDKMIPVVCEVTTMMLEDLNGQNPFPPPTA